MNHAPLIGRKTRTFLTIREVAEYDAGYSAQQLHVAQPAQFTSPFYQLGVSDATEDMRPISFAEFLARRSAEVKARKTFDQQLVEACQ